MNGLLYHFSEDPRIERFVPHVPATNPSHPPAVWAIDAEHSPVYWFPRDCPRVTAWPRHPGEQDSFQRTLGTSALRLHAIEEGWLQTVQDVRLYRYTFDAGHFRRWPAASGQWISEQDVEPLSVEPVGDLLALHEEAQIELRIVADLHPLRKLVLSGKHWDFSIVRFHNAC